MKVNLVKNKLAEIELSLQQLQLWSDTLPSAQALASTTPFACDVMTLEQWLQFIFLPKMHLLIEHHQPLPTNVAIAPMAEHIWANTDVHSPLINLITEMDDLLNDT
ncbi:YqcC family protein [Parashewanella spongiae]|uniref:YqcC family protein n=1 Tax=Parashewanella spongiae TaxID=342950 RepID=A0A3A6TH34_9GAMM|nr:YqcC family protein [Parashewanella spongiae]MCL1079848.1 YqcC family protein [Parashewanella spongiae]RJY06846.1 YqcC family protein [Parashewanella spongiae]